jgi:flagellar biosynthesis/type III secretory pathway protein FliH
MGTTGWRVDRSGNLHRDLDYREWESDRAALYQKGYAKGHKDGYAKGYRDCMDDTEKVRNMADEIVPDRASILINLRLGITEVQP